MKDIYIRLEVAKKIGSKFKWNLQLEKVNAYKKAYYLELKNTYKTVINKRFLEENDRLYLLIPDEDRFDEAFDAVMKIAGVSHVLALILAKGDGNSREYFKHQSNLSKKLFKKNKGEYIRLFEEVIQKFGIHVGNIPKENGSVSWLSSSLAEVKRDTLKQMYSKTPNRFYIIGNKLFFLSPLQHFVEKMFMEGVKIAGGENELAKALAKTEKEEKRFRMAFKRMSFRQTKSFTYYSHLFAEYLQKNRPLFGEDDYAKSA